MGEGWGEFYLPAIIETTPWNRQHCEGAAQSIEQQVHRKQREECYCGVLNDLPENYRVVVLLSEIEGFCAKEIADILGLSVDVVKIRLHRGRERLLAALKNHCRAEDWL